jgi:ABC-type multidrug transport system fused ATPase/permease subunit
MLSNIRKILDLFNAHERKRGFQLLALMCFMALVEMFGVASIFPFIAVLSNPQVVETNALLSKTYELLGFTSVNRFLFFLGVIFFVFVLASIALKAFYTYAQAMFSERVGFSLSQRLVTGYLQQPYEWFLNQHSGDLGKTVLSEVEAVIGGALRPMMEVFARGLIVITLTILLIYVDPWLALGAGGLLGGSYGIIYSIMREKLRVIGQERVKANKERFTAISETFGGIKDIKVSGMEGKAAFRFKGPAHRFARTRAQSVIYSSLPPMALEAMVMGGFVLIMLFYMRDTEQLEEILPKLALYGFAVFRLKPAMQTLFSRFVTLRFSGAALDNLHNSLVSLNAEHEGILSRTPAKPMGLERVIDLDGLTYTYPNSDRPAVRNISMKVPVFHSVGLVGPTGSGKTTLVDILLGLLKPTEGEIRVDGTTINLANIRNWQRSIGYVPQHIYLADTTVAANIAFGLESKEINMAAVEQAARIANLHDFVANDMPNGYQTVIGERGVRLSGGQRQRIGIARALYHDPDVLILDEATSALDNLTERAVMEAVNSLSHKKTIILIAHRLTTVKNCDCIYMLEHGQLKEQGTFQELLEKSETFKQLANE